MDFRILGPLEVLADDGPVALGGTRQRALLAILLLHAGTAVSADRLVEDLWGGTPPGTPSRALWVHVARLRRTLEAGRGKGSGRALLLTRTPGYLLQVGPGELDIDRFERLAALGRERLAAGAAGQAAGLLREALALWRGQALADLATEPFARGHVARLEERRLSVLEDRIDAELALGRHGALVGELDELVAAHPLREGLRARLMLALYRAGRQADALEVYQQARKTLAEELGIDPGPALQRLQQAILTQDPSMEWIEPQDRVAALPRETGPAQPVEPAGAAAAPTDTRKTVTVVQVGIAASAEGDELDPESFSHLEDRYHDAIRASVTRHGGVVRQLTTETAVAVFGVPTSYENDALRAVRAAVDVRSVLQRVDQDLRRERGVRLAFSVGVETGEVMVRTVASGSAALVGTVLGLAQRLEQVGAAGELLLGPSTYGLVRDAVVVEEGPVLGRGGRGRPYRGWRLARVRPSTPGHRRRLDAPIVGRSTEQSLLAQLFERTVSDRAGHLATVLGPAGIGKSRLAHELLAHVGERAAVLRGRCLDYGEGITYWPVAEVVRQALGADEASPPDELRAGVAALLAGDSNAEVVARQVTGLLGLSDTPPAAELPWAVRRLLEALARRRPLIAVLDDLHWAEPALLDLVEHLADYVRDVPFLLVCIARPELYDVRPGWGGGKRNATSILLEPLSGQECAQLVDNLLGGTLPEPVRAWLSAAADGNPLFAEELVAVLIEDGVLVPAGASWVATADLAALPVPPTISALLAARLDRLGAEERAVIERASVVGKQFSRAAVVALTPEPARASVDAHLLALARKELVHPDLSPHAAEDAFRFRHLLIRDAAYGSLPKRQRATLHEAFADWLAAATGGRQGDGEEVVAYHLEQACRYREELGLVDPALVRRTADQLALVGRRAGDRWDYRAAASLLAHARALLPPSDRTSLDLLPTLVAILGYQGDHHQARELASEGIRLARASGERRLEARLLVEQQLMIWTDEEAWTAQRTREELARAIPMFEQAGDAGGLAAAWLLTAKREMIVLRYAAVEDPLRRAVRHARAANDGDRASQALYQFGLAYVYGPTMVPEAIRRCLELGQGAGDNRSMQAIVRDWVASLEAMRGDFARAEALLGEVAATLEDLGSTLGWVPWTTHREIVALVASLCGDHARAEESYRVSLGALEEAGASGVASSEVASLADVVFEQGRADEAEELTRMSEQLATRRDDLLSQLLWRSVRAKVVACLGRIDEALRLSREAVELAARTDALNDRGDAWMNRGTVLRMAGDGDAARAAVRRALSDYASKGNLVGAGRARYLLDG
ncbi:MAG TPA: BTAD domain-containing putative transcriptional regulator [Actinomycetes bacterium]